MYECLKKYYNIKEDIKKLPLWLFILLEAQLLREGGIKLGPIGERLIAEQIIWVLRKSPDYELLREAYKNRQKQKEDFRINGYLFEISKEARR